jgi:hypothetical protein
MVNAFEGNTAETTTMLPVIQAFMNAHRLPDVTVVADAGMVSAANQKAIEAAGLSFILGAGVPALPYVVAEWCKADPDQEIPMGRCSCSRGRRERLTGAGITSFTTSTGPTRSGAHCTGSTSRSPRQRRRLPGRPRSNATGSCSCRARRRASTDSWRPKARAVAGLKGYVTNLAACPDGTPATAQFVIGAHHRLIQVEKSFRMSKHDLQARPIYHHKRESIEAHLSIVFAALAVSRWIEQTTGWSIRRFVRTARRYRTIQIQAGAHIVTAADPLPDGLRHALDRIHHGQLRTQLS